MRVFCVLMGANISALLLCEPRLSLFLNEQAASNLASTSTSDMDKLLFSPLISEHLFWVLMILYQTSINLLISDFQ